MRLLLTLAALIRLDTRFNATVYSPLYSGSICSTAVRPSSPILTEWTPTRQFHMSLERISYSWVLSAFSLIGWLKVSRSWSRRSVHPGDLRLGQLVAHVDRLRAADSAAQLRHGERQRLQPLTVQAFGDLGAYLKAAVAK